jgi:hypothetical protein
MMGVGFLVLACLLGRFSPGQALLCLLSAVGAFGLILLVTHISAAALWQDYHIMMAAQGWQERLRSLAVHGIENVFYLAALSLLVWEMATQKGEWHGPPTALWRHALLMASIFGGELLLLASNTQEGEMPLLVMAGLYGAEIIRRDTRAADDDSFIFAARNLFALILMAVFLLPTFVPDCKTVLFTARNTTKSHWVSTPTMQSTHLRDFRFVANGTRFAEMQAYMATVDEGIQLLRRHPDRQTRLTVLLFSNPFHLALGLTPAVGGVASLSITGFTKRSHPILKRILGNATHILADRDCALLRETYGAEWDALHLEVVEQTKNFTLLKVPEAD